MSAKTNLLRDAMLGVQASPQQTTAKQVQQDNVTRSAPVAPSRLGKRAIGGHFSPEVSRQLRVMSAEQDRSIQELLEEALNDLFRKHNRSAVA